MDKQELMDRLFREANLCTAKIVGLLEKEFGEVPASVIKGIGDIEHAGYRRMRKDFCENSDEAKG